MAMKLVIDTNILISAMLRDSTTRRILLSASIEFLTAGYSIQEVMEHLEEVCKKNGVSRDKNLDILQRLQKHVRIVEIDDESGVQEEAEDLMRKIDPDDAPVIAAALSVDCDGIWSEDPHLLKQDMVRIWRTRDLIQFIK